MKEELEDNVRGNKVTQFFIFFFVANAPDIELEAPRHSV